MANPHPRVGRIERTGRIETIQRVARIEPAEEVKEPKKVQRYNADGKSFQNLMDEELDRIRDKGYILDIGRK